MAASRSPATFFENVLHINRLDARSRELLLTAETTDEALVQQAIERNRRMPLCVEDLFDAFGKFSQMYLRSILMNAVLWSIGSLHYKTNEFVKESTDVFKFIDRNGLSYGEEPEDVATQKYDPTDKMAVSRLTEFFIVAGVVLLILKHRTDHRRLILECGLLYTLSSCFFWAANYEPLLRLGIALTTMFNKTIRYTTLMHVSESIPANLLPFALASTYLFGGAMTTALNLGFKFCTDWRHMGITIGIAYGAASIAYFAFTPTAVLHSLSKCKGEAIRNTLMRWVKDPDAVDVNALIDDTMFRGRPLAPSLWGGVWELLRVRPFAVKFLALVLLRSLRIFILDSASMAAKKMLSFHYYEEILFFAILMAIGPMGGAVVMTRFGRRITILISLLTGIICTLLINHVRYEQFDICGISSHPGKFGKIVVYFAVALSAMACPMLDVAVTTVLLQHIPVQQHSLMFPLAMLMDNGIWAIFDQFRRLKELQWNDFPNHFFTMNLIYTLVLAPLVILIDDSRVQALTAADIPCYRSRKSKYPENPRRDDDPDNEESQSEAPSEGNSVSESKSETKSESAV